MLPGNHIIGNRNSTPDASGSGSSLRPPASRSGLSGHHLRASADMGAFSATPLSNRSVRPASEIYYNPLQNQSLANQDDGTGEGAQWIADIDQYENTLEEMASATMDKDFKDELVAIEQWFKVLSEAERTAALYALLQQTTQVQIRFFIGVLQQMAKNHPMSGVLSPANFGERDAMSNRFNTAMSRLSMDGSRVTVGSGRPTPSSNNVRHSALGQSDINSMFPDAAAAIAQHKAELSQQSMPVAKANRHSMHFGDRNSLITPTITTPLEEQSRDAFQPPTSPWSQRITDSGLVRPRSSMGMQQPMGQFSQAASTSLRSPRPGTISGDLNFQSTSLNALEGSSTGMSLISPYAPGASWASMSNTPMVANFSNQQSGAQADMVANATAMKLAALSTVNNRIQLDDVRKYRRARSSHGQQTGLQASMSGMHGSGLPANFIMTNELGQVLSPQQAAILQAQQLAAIGNRRSRPSSPALTVPGSGLGGLNFGGTHHNGYLSAYDQSSQLLNNLPGINLGAYGLNGSEGYMSDASEINRGRSPRGRRGSSKPPEDPTDVALLKDIPNWLRSLRLHKYTDNLKDMDWQDLVKLDDAGLEARGVNALGARRKMLKVFEDVAIAQAQGKI